MAAPAIPIAVKCLVWTVLPGRVTPVQTVPIDKDDATLHAAVINAGSAVAL